VDYSALNGLGNILFFQRELDAAEFFVEAAIQCAAKAGAEYPQPERDLELIRSRRGALPRDRSKNVVAFRNGPHSISYF
jgi:hypothetical protein